MEWRHATWQCPRCRFKLGCCEGEPAGCEGSAGREPVREVAPEPEQRAGSGARPA
jgi:hypothetical protein